MFDFIPETPRGIDERTPYFEDTRSEQTPGYRTRKSIKTLQAEVASLIERLGGGGVMFQQGKYPGNPMRHGYVISFSLMSSTGVSLPCRMHVAALPLRSEKPDKVTKALAHALYMFRDWLQGELNALVLRPGYVPFIPFMIGPGGETVAEIVAKRNRLLPATNTSTRLLPE